MREMGIRPPSEYEVDDNFPDKDALKMAAQYGVPVFEPISAKLFRDGWYFIKSDGERVRVEGRSQVSPEDVPPRGYKVYDNTGSITFDNNEPYQGIRLRRARTSNEASLAEK